jgi:ADP-ribose pyrophosphatase
MRKNPSEGQPFPVELIEQRAAFRGHLKVDELRLRHGLFGGGMSDVMTREVIWRRDAVVVIPYDPERDEVVLIEQFRASALFNGDRAWMVEFVAGLIEDGETPEAVGIRELQEESGLEPLGPLLHVTTPYSTPGFASERFHLYCAPVDASKAGGIHGLVHEHEDIRVFSLPFTEAYAFWQRGGGANTPVSIGILWLALHREKLQREWGDPGGLPHR